MNKNKKAIIVAGQSNTHTSSQFGYDPIVTGVLDMGIKHLSRDASDTIPITSGISNISFQGINGTQTSYAYPLAKRIKDTLYCDELIIIPCAVGGTGWSNDRWSANGDLYLDMIARTRYAIEVLDCEIVGFFWSQGETDSNEIFAPVYQYLLDSLAMTIRDVAEAVGQASARTIPFVTFDMVANWVGTNHHRLLVQQALATVGDRIPFAANIDTTDLPADLDGDIIHYDTRQIMKIGDRMYDAWKIARRKNNDHLATPGEYLIHSLSKDYLYANKWEALHFGNEVEPKYSRLGDIWKYRQSKKYCFRLEFDIVGGDTKSITFEQGFIPFMFDSKDSPASLVAITTDTQYGAGFSGFSGLTYNASNASLVSFSGRSSWFLPCGQTVLWNEGIPVSHINRKIEITNTLRLYTIVN